MLGTIALNCIVGFDLPVKVAGSLKSQKTNSLSKLNISCFDFYVFAVKDNAPSQTTYF
jgi:hypothetical protein